MPQTSERPTTTIASASFIWLQPQNSESSGEPTPEAKSYGPFVINLPSADNNEAALNKWIAQHPNGVGGGWCAELVHSLADSFGNSQGRPLFSGWKN